MLYKILIDSQYRGWSVYNAETMVQVNDIDIHPLDYKLLTGDIFSENKTLINSPMREEKNIPGILLLVGKTYGRCKNGVGRFYYKCIPDDKRLPSFLVPYEEKVVGFNKNKVNQYILFKYVHWAGKHPTGIVTSKIGDVKSLTSFYEYYLYCKNLVISIKEFTKVINRSLKENPGFSFTNNITKKYPQIKDRRENNIITIDPVGSMDLDDAVGIENNILSIYIANVPLLIDELLAWISFSQRISTIYLPDRKCSMLPTILSENLCSLLENEDRLAFCIDIEFNDNNEIVEITFCNVLIKIRKNYRYDEKDLIENKEYQNIYQICSALCNKYKYMKEIRDSHDLVAFLMILMNTESANKMLEYKNGIYRTLTIKPLNNPTVSNQIIDFIKIWQSSSGQYTTYEAKSGHDLVSGGIENYIHITSPIRRLVDLLNMIQLQQNLNLIDLSITGKEFYLNWYNKLEYINTSMRAIKKVQTDCNILCLCVNNPEVLNEVYDGYIFDGIERTSQMLQYTVYIPKIKIITRVNIKYNTDNSTDNMEEYSCHKFKLYLIEDGMTLKRKIRAELYNRNTL
jgi:exoribonuclease R